MDVQIFSNKGEMGSRAAAFGASLVRNALAERGQATIVVATGASQFEMLASLVQEPGIAWNRVTAFHLDEYAEMPMTHPASFRGYLWSRFVSKLPTPVREFHWINGEGDCAAECRRLGDAIGVRPIDVAFVGIGENGHLAFNDPPADFEIDDPYIVVELDEACRRQQLGEGWFPSLEAVPRRAISMSIKQIMKCQAIVCTVPDDRKAKAVRAALEADVTPDVPASILQRHPRATLFLDEAAASLLSRR